MHRVQHKDDKTASPLQYILQAAMGQCSNLPTNGGNNNDSSSDAQVSTSSVSNHKSPRGYGRSSNSSSTRKSYREQRDSFGYRNGRPIDEDRHDDGDVVMGEAFVSNERHSRGSSRDVNRLVNIAKQGNAKFDEYMNEDEDSQPSYHSKSARLSSRNKIAPTPEEVLPPPPLGSVRMRCYRLNLDAPVILSPTHDHLGPMPYDPPAHLLPQLSSRSIQNNLSADSTERNPTQAAINTARIFRGITVDRNGTILSQNARASRSTRGKDKSKQAVSSRQMDKINKAKDLVDDAGASGGGKENDGEKSNMVSLVVIGEYDEMKQLVRDGAKKLRDAEGLPDEALLAINRPRQSISDSRRNIIPSSPSSTSSRKRLSSPSQVMSPSETSDSRSRYRLQQNNQMMLSTPPKLKSNPRDRPSARRLTSGGESETEKRRYNGNIDKCNDMSIFGGGDSDWSDALGLSKGFDSIWNCGATGTNSPNNKTSAINLTSNSSSGRRSSKVRYEGRNETSARFSRGGGVTAERDAPASKDVMI